jgi:acyl dehydratase
MALPTKHILHQGGVIASLGGTAFSALKQRIGGGAKSAPPTPGPVITQTVAPRPPDLVKDYIRHVGGDPAAYRGIVPAHLFPQWGFPLAARTLRDIPYPMLKVLNGGCRLEVASQLPLGEPLQASACLVDIDDNGRRAVLHQKVVTGTASAPEAVTGHLYAIVPLGGPPEETGEPRPKADKPRVPAQVREIGYWRLPADAGLAFAMLTGDFNPVHWVRPYARASGFRSMILHGFSTMARAIEGLNRSLFSGDARALVTFDCKFTRPLVLPAAVGLYVKDDQVFVGDAPGGPAYLVGSFQTRPARE